MSTSLLYHAFGIRGYVYRRTRFEEGSVVFTVRQKRSDLRCSECGSKAVQRRGDVTRELQHVPIGGKPVFVELDVARVHCPKCDHIRQVQVPLAEVSA